MVFGGCCEKVDCVHRSPEKVYAIPGLAIKEKALLRVKLPTSPRLRRTRSEGGGGDKGSRTPDLVTASHAL